MTRYGMAVDLSRCVGCNACAMACKVSNNLPKNMWWNVVHTDGWEAFDTARGEYGKDNHMQWYPVNCMHCDNPACETVCPTGATRKREDGIVDIDFDQCIGCKSCMMACPYDVRRFLDKSPEYYTEHLIGDETAPALIGSTVSKCNFCAGRLDRGDVPACMELCPGRARYFGDLDDPQSEISRALQGRDVHVLHEEAGTKPNFYYFE